MKKAILLLCAMFALIPLVNAQNVPNGGMENWEINSSGGLEPVSWQTLNTDDFTNTFQVAGHTGQYAARLSVEWDAVLEMYTAPMFFLDDNFNVTERFTAFNFFVEGTAVGGDYLSVSVGMFKNGELIGTALTQINQAYSSWTQVSMPIEYLNGETPDQCFIGIHIYPVMGSNTGTYYTIDDLNLDMGTGTSNPVMLFAETNTAGSAFELAFSKAMADPSGTQNQFAGTRNSNPVVFTAASLKPGDNNTIVLSLGDPVIAGDVLKVSYTAGTVATATGAPLLTFSNHNVVNRVGAIAPSWQVVPSGVIEDLFAVHFASTMNGFISGSEARCLKSGDGGDRWNPVSVPSVADFQSVWATSANDAYLGGWDTVYATHNGGQSWAGAYTHLANYAVNELQFLSPQNGFAFMSWSQFAKTTNGGNTWSLTNGGGFTALDFFGGFMLDQNTGWGVGDLSMIAKTTDGGESWVPYEWNNYLDYTDIQLWAVYATSASNAWIAADSGVVFRTMNGGDTWSRNTIAGPEDRLTDVYFINSDIGYIVGFNGKIFKTVDGGNTWFPEPQLTVNNLNAVFFISENLGWAVGNNGTILRYSGSGLTSLTDFQAGGNPVSLSVFPNPADKLLNLSLEIRMTGNYDLEILDQLGCVVKSVVQSPLPPGTYTYPINSGQLPAGVYLCKLSNGLTNSIKKAIVIH